MTDRTHPRGHHERRTAVRAAARATGFRYERGAPRSNDRALDVLGRRMRALERAAASVAQAF